MAQRENKTIKMITTNEEEILEKLVAKDHAFRKLNEVVNFAEIVSMLCRGDSAQFEEGG